MAAGVSERVRLSRHPQSGAAPALEIEVEVARNASSLTLTYIIRGDIAAVALPNQTKPARIDGLWQHTCFEAFVRSTQSEGYWEFNFSPSHQWALYRFDGYRLGMTAEPAIIDPHIELGVEGSELQLSAVVDLCGIEALAANNGWRLGLSAVIEDRNGGRSYWALAHPAGKPDFHHADSFALQLSP